MELSPLEITGTIILLLLFSKRIFNLSLSIFITSSTVMISLLALSASALILAIASIPTLFVGCKIAENVYADTTTPQAVVSLCGIKTKVPKVVRSRSVMFSHPQEYPHIRPTSAPGKY